MVYFSVPLLIMGWFILLIILALIIRAVRHEIINLLSDINKFMDEMTDVKVSTKTTFRRPLRFKS